MENTSNAAQATVAIDDTTYELRPLKAGPDDDFSSFGTAVAGALPGTM